MSHCKDGFHYLVLQLQGVLLTATRQRFAEDLFGGTRERQGGDEAFPLQEERYSDVELLCSKVNSVIRLIRHLISLRCCLSANAPRGRFGPRAVQHSISALHPQHLLQPQHRNISSFSTV